MTRSSSSLKKLSLTATLGLLFFAVSASAQQKAQVNVPFAFTANQVSLPAGHYQVLASDSSLTFINMENRKTEAMVLGRNEQGTAVASRGSMRFEVSGNRYFLTGVRFAGSSSHCELYPPKGERLSAGSTQRKSDEIEIAMK